MKNKMKKVHKTKMDYFMKKLGGISFIFTFVALAVIIPLSNKFEKENLSINYNINLMEQQERFVKPISEHKKFVQENFDYKHLA